MHYKQKQQCTVYIKKKKLTIGDQKSPVVVSLAEPVALVVFNERVLAAITVPPQDASSALESEL